VRMITLHHCWSALTVGHSKPTAGELGYASCDLVSRASALWSAPKGSASDNLQREGCEGVCQVDRLPSWRARSRRPAVAPDVGRTAAQAAARQLLSRRRHGWREGCQAAGVEQRLARRAKAGPVLAPGAIDALIEAAYNTKHRQTAAHTGISVWGIAPSLGGHSALARAGLAPAIRAGLHAMAGTRWHRICRYQAESFALRGEDAVACDGVGLGGPFHQHEL